MSGCKTNSGAVDACKQSVQALVDAIQIDQLKLDEYLRQKAEQDKWASAKAAYMKRLDASTVAAPGHIWEGSSQFQCSSYSPYMRAWPNQNSMQKCSEITGTRHAACTAAGVTLCACDSGQCTRPATEFTVRKDAKLDQHSDAWDRVFPPPYPNLTPYPRQENYPNIICQECTSCVEFSDLAAGGDINVESVNQAMNCVANMTNVTNTAQAEHDRKVDEASTRLARLQGQAAELDAALARATLDGGGSDGGSGGSSSTITPPPLVPPTRLPDTDNKKSSSGLIFLILFIFVVLVFAAIAGIIIFARGRKTGGLYI